MSFRFTSRSLDGENADPANGSLLEDGLFARSLGGELAYRLVGRAGFERVRQGDEQHEAFQTLKMTQTVMRRPGVERTALRCPISIDGHHLTSSRGAPILKPPVNV